MICRRIKFLLNGGRKVTWTDKNGQLRTNIFTHPSLILTMDCVLYYQIISKEKRRKMLSKSFVYNTCISIFVKLKHIYLQNQSTESSERTDKGEGLKGTKTSL